MSSGAKNRAFWNGISGSYQATHGAALDHAPMAWGVWRMPESELGVLGHVEGRHVLELGCGAAQWTIALGDLGAWSVGVDLSEGQLHRARALSPTIPLVHGSAESLPFRSESFDVVFCDHGAMVFAPPHATVPEASRVLKRNGLFAFCMSSPIRDICYDPASNTVAPKLTSNYFSLSAFDDGASVEYQLPYGEWIRLFRRHELDVEDLIELRAPDDATTTFSDFVPVTWARQWPAEHIWKLRKQP
ncbi:MAG TPA: class I SAM-dependent methyltransferase [Vicinamibacterales bacterium]|jgi:SAM-dependent methyltransferase|nr:class I SAM-dependent methyltransferase [Vicinamibacterales bacterium]